MCGIVGAVSAQKKILSVLLNGLKALEYRGYDSAGVSYFKDEKIKIIKEKGCIASLEKKLNLKEDTNIGIAHTRWATHGKASKTNAHPHQVGNITIVHNGIIENYEELKKELLDKDYTFKSDTDTEVACALLNYYYEEYKDINKAIIEFISKATGSYAISLLINNDKENIYVIKKESPLIIGISNDMNLIASDVPTILKYTNKYYLLDDFEFAKVNAKNIEIYNKEGKTINKDIKEYKGNDLTADKGKYDHYMLKEIHDQKNTILKTVANYITDIKTLLTLPDLTKYKYIDIVACGTAMHTGLVAKYLFSEYTNTKCDVHLASEYRYQNNFLDEDKVVIFISQSGETADTLAALKKVKKANTKTIGIINVKESSIARGVDEVIYVEAGTEIAVASTKAYTAQVAILSLLVLAHGYRKKLITEEKTNQILEEFKNIKTYLNKIFKDEEKYIDIAKTIYKTNDIFYIGRGLDYALCMEGALKLKEVSYIHSEAYAAGELKHGTISLIEKDTPVFASATDKNLNPKTISNLKEVIARGANVFLITDDKTIIDSTIANYILIPEVSMFLKSILIIIPYQFIAYYTSITKGCNVDKPKNLAKSVTVE